jgi:penicillin-binding protein 1A
MRDRIAAALVAAWRWVRGRGWRFWLRWLAAPGAALALLVTVLVYWQLPDIAELGDYHPKQALRVFTADGVEIGKYGVERRYFLALSQTPKLMQDALLATEDAGFRSHFGFSITGIARAFIANTTHLLRTQGGSTITQQVARTFYLSSRKTYDRKFRELLLAVKIESQLNKDQILELYMNQIYLGQHAYGFETASHVYFGKPLSALSAAECAMLAGLPQNPSYANPVVNFERARRRQLVVLERMRVTGVLTEPQYQAARAEQLHVRRTGQTDVHAEYVAEMVRQGVVAQFGEQAYTVGYKVYTSLLAQDQRVAYQALRREMLEHDRRQPWRGPEDEESLPDDARAGDSIVSKALADYADDDELRVALVTQADARSVVATLASGEVVTLSGEGLRWAQPALSPRASKALRLQRGSVVRVQQRGAQWFISQWPEAQGAFVAMEPNSGQVRALVGGFDFTRNQFNHVTQAWRQPGSSFKPLLYSAALEHGVMPATLVDDAPLSLDMGNGNVWEPRNSDGQFDGPLTLRQALAKSKNLVSVRLARFLGPQVVRDWVANFGLDPERQPDNLTLALGTGAATPMQMVAAYAVLANGGYGVKPVVILKVTDAQDHVLFAAPPVDTPHTEAQRAIPQRNAFVTASLLQEVTRSGTAAMAQQQLKRPDLYGKTGTTTEAVDAWFAGFQPSVVAVAWMGYDDPRSLGGRESGGALALPIWIEYMRHALKGVPVNELSPPPEVIKYGGDWIYSELALDGFVERVGFDDTAAVTPGAGVPGSPAGQTTAPIPERSAQPPLAQPARPASAQDLTPRAPILNP